MEPRRPDQKKERKKISVCELHRYLISERSIYQLKDEIDESTRNQLMSDIALRVLMTKNVRKMVDR